MFSKKELTAQIAAMGILPTDTVLIHTSMRAIGAVENGADGVIDAFRDYLTDGLFLVPTHTWANVHHKQPIYDVKTSVPNIGALPRVAAFRADGVRSLNPTHSMWACGKGAADFVKNEENAPTSGAPGFAWERLAHVGAKILLIGVGNDKNTFIHAVEELANVPDRLGKPYEITIRDGAGNEYKHLYASYHCSKCKDVSHNFGNFEKAFIALGAQHLGRLGNAEVRVVDAAACRDIILRILSRTNEDLCLEKRDIEEELYL